LKEAAKGIGLGLGRTYALSQPGGAAAAGAAQVAIDEAAAQRLARQFSEGNLPAIESAVKRKRIEELSAQDPSLFGKVTRGAVSTGIQSLPFVAAGGAPLATAAVGGLMSLDRPEDIPLSVGLGLIGGPGGAQAVERVLGKGAAQIVEQEAAQGARAATGEAGQMTLPGMQLVQAPAEPLQQVLPGLENVIKQEAAKVPESLVKRIASEVSSFPRAMMSSLDISAPGRQGLLLAVAPSRWGAAIKAGGRMFAAFKPEAYERITKAIASDPDAVLAERSGLYLAFRQAEEFFTSKIASKIPGVQASQRAYETFLDSLRMSTFSQYKRIILKSGLDSAQTTQALEAAAKWINIATGRGSLGKRFDDAVPLLSQFLFAPRYTASRLQVLNPVMYARNYMNPATRPVAKAQMADLAQYLGAVATTFGLAKAMGFDVGLDPKSGDFLKIRAGNKVYDPGAGLTQVMRFAIRAGYDLFGAAKGDKAGYGKDAVTLTERFIRSKLAPIPSYAADFFSRRTYEGKEFTSGGARAVGVIERVAPLTWSDFASALWNEGLGSAAATLPGAIGIGVQSYARPGGILERAQPLFSEYQRAGRGIPEIRRFKNEPDDAFNARVKVHGEALEKYGLDLVNSPEYKAASPAERDKALDLLPRRISTALLKQGESWTLEPRVLMSDVRENQQLRHALPGATQSR
jgi:hypothetical protein